MAVRLAAIDLDGTLLRSDGTISSRTRRALADAQERGLIVVLVCARHPAALAAVAADASVGGLAVCSNRADSATVMVPGPWTVEVSAAGVDKAATFAELCAELAIEASEVVAFGDYLNDLPMLAWAGRAIAVANAHPDVLSAVSEVTASNDDDGVAAVLETLPAQGRS